MKLKHRDHFHGSDLEKIEAIYGIKKEEITSFSANVNPLGISPLLRKTLCEKIDVISSYPDRDYLSLRTSIAAYCDTEVSNIIVGNGTTELISLIVQVRKPKRAMIIAPTYSEYERALSIEGASSYYYPLEEKNEFQINIDDFLSHLNSDLDFLIICNPNNPTSTVIDPGSMRRILNECMRHHIFVMVDETYMEFVSDIKAFSSIALTSYYNNLIILRGTSKFFAAPGLRLGYAVTGNQELIRYINTCKNPWMINSLAAAAGELMFSDTSYIEETKALIESEKKSIAEELSKSGLYHIYQPSANFMLAKILKRNVTSGMLFEKAILQKMMIRDCSTFPFLDDHFIRLCVMTPEMNTKLIQCLTDLD